MNLSSSSLPAVSPIRRPSRPVRLRGAFEGEQGDLLRKLQDRLPACGAWVFDTRPGDYRESDYSPGATNVELRFEVQVRSAWQLYTLLLRLGLQLTPASHRELCTLCAICQNRDLLAAGAVVEMMLEVSWGAPSCEHSCGADRSQA